MEAIGLLAFKGARELFETLRAHPRRQFSISELSRASELPFTTTWKLVRKFELAQMVEVVTIGRSRAVRYMAGPYSRLVESILKISASPQALALPGLRRILKANGGVLEAYLFGSVASNTEKLGSDVDVALLTSKKIDVPSIMSTIYEKYGVKAMPLCFGSKDELEDFLRGKKNRRIA
ncbi:MAG: nucleotidyltransferase domain-containing protein [Candidatus Micrarchaeota archaeon]